MNKLSKEKRTQLIDGLWHRGRDCRALVRLIAMQHDKETRSTKSRPRRQIEKMQKVRMAVRAGYCRPEGSPWTIGPNRKHHGFGRSVFLDCHRHPTIQRPQLQSGYATFGAPVVKPVTLMSVSLYQQASVNVSGTAYYDDLGKFLADFENHFPYMRVQNLNLEPGWAE